MKTQDKITMECSTGNHSHTHSTYTSSLLTLCIAFHTHTHTQTDRHRHIHRHIHTDTDTLSTNANELCYVLCRDVTVSLLAVRKTSTITYCCRKLYTTTAAQSHNMQLTTSNLLPSQVNHKLHHRSKQHVSYKEY